MEKVICLLLFTSLLVSCAKKDDCLIIREKASQNGEYYFIDRSGFFDENTVGGQVNVSLEVYNQYSIGDEYCID